MNIRELFLETVQFGEPDRILLANLDIRARGLLRGKSGLTAGLGGSVRASKREGHIHT